MTSAELLDRIQARRLAVKQAEDEIKTLSGMLEVKMEAEGLANLSTDDAVAFWQPQTKVEVKDWNAVMEFVMKNNAFDILQKRISPNALKARFEAGAKIAGVSYKEGAKTFIVKGKKDEDKD